ncbi:SWIM zinc finger family protein [Streptomyces sp. NPDC001668]|uniref:SWIM zinc finger family protein n=1 Tax=unclassified Streptomyces TaxID=2593676 RepID=UPI0036CAF882
MTPGPAEEARRALRAARERAEREAKGGADGATATGADREVVREAASAAGAGGSEAGAGGAVFGSVGSVQAGAPLPDGVEARRGSVVNPAGVPPRGEGDGAAAVEATGGQTDRDAKAAAGARDTGAGRPGARPADAAREALRAARKRRADAEAAEAEATARRSRRSTPAMSRDRGRTPGSVAGARARDVRELLADVFRMPDDAAPPGDERESNDPAQQGSYPGKAAPVPDGATDGLDTAAPTPADETPTPPGASHSTTYASPRHPHSMAAPNRDNDLRRTFPAFPPRTSEDSRFAATWWGNAWVAALEEGALDVKRLARGRSYAEQGHVDAITVTPGLVLAYVKGSRPRPYRVQVRLRTLGDADWDRFLDLAADRTGHIAALLDREMPQALADCGVPLLPGPGDLEPQCSCPDRGHPCKHAAALCYQTARLLDADPFVLLLLRGRGERELLDALSRLSAARAARAAQEHEPAPLPGVRASEALAPRRLPPLPAPLPVPPHPEQPPAYPASPGGPDPFALDQLATDAAARAHALLGTGRDPVGELTLWQDAVRLAAARPGSGLTAGTRALYASLAAATDRTPADLARAVAAWRQGGLEGLAVLEEPWDPPAGRFDRARPLLLAADLPAFRPSRNHLTHPRGHLQLRLGRDGLWYAYESEPGRDDWWPRGTPDLDPVGALTGLGTPTDF